MKKLVYLLLLSCLIFLAMGINAQVMINPVIPGECAPVIIDLYNISVVSISDTAIWEWDINGDIYDDFQLVGKVFQAGYYDITLTLYDGPDYVGENYLYFEIYPGGDSFVISTGDQACPGEQIQFNYDDEIIEPSVLWTFGDNSVTEDQHRYNWPTHTFFEPGVYDVTLIIDHYCGPDTVVRQVTVSPGAIPKVKGYLASDTVFCPSDPVHFDVEGEYTAYHWDFGDGASSDERRPAHVYPTDNATSYKATVSATNICGNSNTSDVIVTFREDIEADAGFDYYHEAYSSWPCPGTPVQFDAWGAGIFEWDFGDGSISNERKPTNHYTEPGIYDVGLTVWNGCGDMDFSQQTVEVQLNPSDFLYALFYFEMAGTQGDQLWDDTLSICPGMPINLVDASSSDSPSDLSYDWDFGDGRHAFAKNPSHVWDIPSATPYQVTLNISSSCGSSSSFTRWVLVDANLKPDVTPMVTPLRICPGEEVYFYLNEGMESGDYTFDIEFGDGTPPFNGQGYGDPILQTIANHTYNGTDGESFDYVFNVTNTCGNSLQTTGSIILDTDPTKVPFYYVDNTTTMEGSGQFNDWSTEHDTSDHEFVIHAAWPIWPGTQDKFAVFFWYGGFDIDGDQGPPDGYVEFQTSNIVSGEMVHAFIPVDPLREPSIGFAVGWSCSGLYPRDVEPEAIGVQLDFVGLPLTTFSLVPGGFTDALSYGDPIILDMSWDGICNDVHPDGDYYYQLNPGQYILLELDSDMGYYSLGAYGDPEGYDWLADLDYGDYTVNPDTSILLTSWMACSDINGYYDYILNGDQLDLIPTDDVCADRNKYLGMKTFLKRSGMGEEAMLAGCPGDEIQFSVAGGISYEWHFGDGMQSTERYPRHIYAAAGEYDAFVVAMNGCGRRDSIHTPVRITNDNLPRADFWWDGYDTPRMQEINFFYDDYGIDRAGNYTYYWEFGDGSTSNLMNPVHAYERNGDYTIKLTVSNGCGSNSSVKGIYIADAILDCEAKIQVVGIAGKTITLRDISRGEISKWFWDFGDGFTSKLKDPVHTYDRDGVYFVCLSVYDSINDCSQQVCRMVEIGTQLCRANFTSKGNDATRKVQFTDLSTNATEWFWEFGDGEYDDVQNPLHVYSEPGRYNVCLSIYNNTTDCYEFRCIEIQVGEEDPDFCYADFEFFVNEDDNSLIFNDMSSENITDWYWTFGDGTYLEKRNAVKKYSAPGIYQVCLIVFDEETGCADETCMEIPVGVSDCNLRSDFAFFINVENKEVSFSDRSGGIPTDYFWDFGDGMTSSARSPKHKYEKPGFYLISLSIWDEANGCSDHAAEFIQVGAVDCRAGFEYQVDAATQNVQFYNQSKGTLAEYFWDFDDGTFSDEKDPQHHFNKPGLYFVSLTVITANGLCMDFMFEPLQVGTVDCAAKFKYFIDSSSNVAYFRPDKIGAATAYVWFFGDGAISTNKEAMHKFSQPGFYSVGLNTYDLNTGCMDYWEEVILIGSAGRDCRADFSYISDPDTKKVKFGDRSKGSIVEYLWDFGDGHTSTLQNPENEYARGGYYMVCLTVVNSVGIPNTHCDYVQLATMDEERCFAEFFYSVDSASRTVEFVQQSHGDPDRFIWNFGDGTPPLKDKENPTHTYEGSDFYLVELSIENSSTNCRSKGYALINVSQGNKGLQSAFSYRVDSSDLKAETYPVDFIGVSLGDAGKLKWDFGDGEVDTTSLNPTHVYSESGIYTVCLIISDPVTGDVDSSCQEVKTSDLVSIDQETDWRNIIGNYPNPFDLTTNIVYELSAGTSVNLALFDQTGRMIDILIHQNQLAGRYRIEYDGSGLDPGIYTLRLATDQGVYIARMVVR